MRYDYTPTSSIVHAHSLEEEKQLIRETYAVIERNTRVIESNERLLRPFFWYHDTIRIPALPRPREWNSIIWRNKDGSWMKSGASG